MIYQKNPEGLYLPDIPVVHRDKEYDPKGFDLLREMQTRHFWYLGRYHFILWALKKMLRSSAWSKREKLNAIDLGGGCGGWIKYITDRIPHAFSEVAVGDSSICALETARNLVGAGVDLYQTDLLRLGWNERWDVAFLLDVLEHIPHDIEVLHQIKDGLRPGGLLFVTAPALKFFWSYNDEWSHHVRRYAREDFVQLAERTGFELLDARYFMFFLSPLLLLSRLKEPDFTRMNDEQISRFWKHTHRTPKEPLNWLLKLVFELEAPLGLWIPFPWGTSILGVFKKA